jgi:thiamine-monophosphate kinase
MSRGARRGRTIADLGEFGFLSRLLSRPGSAGRGIVVGPGQDCALLRVGTTRLLFTVDVLVEGVHFERAWLSSRQLGRKSFLVNASDVAAMGGQPRFCVISLAVPAAYPAQDLFALQAGIVVAARECGAVVVGGNLARATQLSVSISLLGVAPKRIVTRQGARPGDRVYVTGTLGDAALGVRLLRGGKTRPAEPIRRFRAPTPRLRVGRLLVESGVVSAMLDVSDGLVQDLGHIGEQSGVGAVIEADRVPLSPAYRAATGIDLTLALHGGEDYELLCTVPERKVKQLERMRARLACPIACIGRITAGRSVRVVGSAGEPLALQSGGYDHFRRSR